jgi:hypothetical protein
MSGAVPTRVAKTRSPAATAARGVRDILRSTGQPLDRDTRRDMESRFAADFSAVRVHTNAKAADSAQALGALAFSVGPDIAFAHGRYAPSSVGGRHLLAHELAHVVQHGRRTDSVSGLTVGPEGDAAERTAHDAAGKVSTGERIPPIPSVPGRPVLRRYALYDAAEQLAGNSLGWKHPGGKPLRVADDGDMVAEDNGWGANLSKRAWTTPALVADSNARLAAQGSKVKLVVKGDHIAGKAPEGGMDRTLNEIEPVNAAGGVLTLASDCGSACKEVMGTSGGKDVAVLKEEGNSGIGSAIGAGLASGILGAVLGYAAGGGAGGAVLGGAVLGGIGAYAGYKLGHKDPRTERLTPRGYHGGNPTTAEQWSEELYKKEFGQGLTRQEAYARYAALSESEKDAFDRKYGINKYAVPDVGQGLTVSTEKDMPGFAPASGFTWNFHYAATVLRSGSDYITLESAAGWGPDEWIFFMYGPASKKQSFHEFQGGTGTHGTKFTTLVVEPEHPAP